MRRRESIGLVGGATAVWPLTARGQQVMFPVIGFTHLLSPEATACQLAAFRQGVKEAGYVEGQNIAIEYRWSEGHYERLPALAICTPEDLEM